MDKKFYVRLAEKDVGRFMFIGPSVVINGVAVGGLIRTQFDTAKEAQAYAAKLLADVGQHFRPLRRPFGEYVPTPKLEELTELLVVETHSTVRIDRPTPPIKIEKHS